MRQTFIREASEPMGCLSLRPPVTKLHHVDRPPVIGDRVSAVPDLIGPEEPLTYWPSVHPHKPLRGWFPVCCRSHTPENESEIQILNFTATNKRTPCRHGPAEDAEDFVNFIRGLSLKLNATRNFRTPVSHANNRRLCEN